MLRNTHKVPRKLNRLLDQVNALNKHYHKLSDSQLKDESRQLQQKARQGRFHADSILPKAYALVRETDRRVLSLYPFDEQVLGGIVLNQGSLSEMKTGEGKTLTETMPVYLNALSGRGVHVVTVNNYLSHRDATYIGQVFKFLGLTVGYNAPDLSFEAKKQAYAADITYSTNSELAFDYLKDNMAYSRSQQLQRGLNYAIIDEADSILIDEARTPLIISGAGKSYAQIYQMADRFVKTLAKDDYHADLETKTVTLLDSGINKANEFFGIHNLFSRDNLVLAHYVSNALKANYTMHSDVDYVIKGGDAYLVDQFTGRVMTDRRFANGLHQAIEAKESLPIHAMSHTDASITYQNYFRMYDKIAGMTGTAHENTRELYETYHMQVIQIPTHKPNQRHDYSTQIYATIAAKDQAVLALVKKLNKRGQPVLVGTTSVEASERLADLFAKNWIKAQVLNAKNNQAEAKVIAKAGQKYAVTIATNMAGRGTDIKLGPGVKELGGLFVIGTAMHEAKRIDNQLRGRAGRQGDPGASQFFVSLQDDLILRYGSEHLHTLGTKYQNKHIKTPLKGHLLHRLVSNAQAKVEGKNYDQRRSTLHLDNVLRLERNIVYQQRQKIIDGHADMEKVIRAMIARTIEDKVNQFTAPKKTWNLQQLDEFINDELNISFPDVKADKPDSMLPLKNYLLKQSMAKVGQIKQELSTQKQYEEFERVVLLKSIDREWKQNMDNMEQLKLSVFLRGYGQHNPLVEYQNLAQGMYKDMQRSIDERVARNVLNAEIRQAGVKQG